MPTRPKFFLLDAGPVIELHRLELWDAVLDRADVIVPRAIADHEADFSVRESGAIKDIRVNQEPFGQPVCD
jgi:hypothetical protein